jgi:transcriptional regulator with XRE-family HTH domain
MWLREIRNKELAEKTGLSPQAISDYRRGLKPPPERRKKIAKALKVTEADLGWEMEGVGV